MNAVEIEEAVSLLVEQPFSPDEFPYAFLEAFGNKETTIKRLRSGTTNKSDLGGVLRTNNIHIATCTAGEVSRTLTALRESQATAKAKAKFILATDGVDFQAENLFSVEPPVICAYEDFPDHFGYFLALAGISTVRQITENSFDIRATSRLNRLYVELRKDNPDLGTRECRHDMNHFMARLIFCFFAEDTGIFNNDLFTSTVEQMSDRDASNTHEVIQTLFLAMNTRVEDRLEEIQEHQFFIVQGQIAYIADAGKDFKTQYDRRDSRLRVVYDNGTESDLLMRSFQRALHRDEAARVITSPDPGPLFTQEPTEEDLSSGTVYVLRSKSEQPDVAKHRELLHKIGVTGGKVEARLANAKLEATFLMAEVEVVATYVLYNVNRLRLENVIHRPVRQRSIEH